MADQRSTLPESIIREIFTLFDTDRSGSISTHELEAAMRCFGKKPIEDDVREVADENGNITETNFIALMKRKLHEEETEEEIHEAFQVFDRDGYGLLWAENIRHAMTNLGGNLTETEADEILKDAEIYEADEQVDYKDLIQMVTSC